ncbi:MAG TPA: ElyC/SanA/YdcF family protein [Chthoniobacteraceae bacterium]|jgi:SanA protein
MRRFRIYLLLLAGLALAGAAFVGLTNYWILRTSQAAVYASLPDLPANDVGIVLGTSPLLAGGTPNPFFVNRVDAAASLYRAGKVRHLLLTGDNGRRQYDEPTAMHHALLERGVPAEAMTSDYAGFRTLDSMARAHAVFEITRCTLVTDDFHLPRALFLARRHGLEASGFASRPVPWRWSKKTRLREIGSRVKAWLDVYLLQTQPRFFGPKVKIPLQSK